jgi:hypothetical protein
MLLKKLNISIHFWWIFLFPLCHVCGQSEVNLFQSKPSNARKSALPSNSYVQREDILTLNSACLNNGMLPQNINFNLFNDFSVSVDLEKKPNKYFKNLEVYWGKSKDKRFAHLAHYRDVVLVYNPQNKKITVSISANDKSFQISPTLIDGEYKVSELKEENQNCLVDQGIFKNQRIDASQQAIGCEEKDSTGRYVADIFVGYSFAAANITNDIDAHALSMVEMVNTGLNNSLVTNIYCRLVGTGIDNHNPGVVTSVLSNVSSWFAEEIALTAPDFVASVQVPMSVTGEAGGWGSVGGWFSVNSVYSSANVFRHEIGHNIGSQHCTAGILPYASGYNNGNVQTHMCGNSVNFYSTPLILDNLGLPLGNASTADNARVWRERASILSSNRKHTIKFNTNEQPCSSSLISNGVYQIQHLESQKFIGTLNGGVANGTALTLNDSSAATQWRLQHIGYGKFVFKHNASGKLMNVPGSSSTIGTDLTIQTASGSNSQNFEILGNNIDSVSISTFNGQCVKVENNQTSIGAKIEQNICNTSIDKLWRLIPVISTPTFTVQVNTVDISCYGKATGSATAVATGGNAAYTYLWSTGETTATISNLITGNYWVNVSSGSASLKYSFTITQTPPFGVNITKTSTNSSINGTATVAISGAKAPYSFLWSNGQTGNSANNLAATEHFVVITDATGCSLKKPFNIGCSDLYKPCSNGNANTLGSFYDESCQCSSTTTSCSEKRYNIASGKPTSQSSNLNSSSLSNLAVDNNFANSSISQTKRENYPWWQIDLKQSIPISDMVFWNRIDCCMERLDSMYVFISDVPFLSNDFEQTKNQAGVTTINLVSRKLPNSVVSPNIIGRYIRVQLDKKSEILNLNEVQIFSCGNAIPTAVAVNPVQGTKVELKGMIVGHFNTTQKIEIEYGKNDFGKSILIDTTGRWMNNDTLWISKIIDIDTVNVLQFRIKITTSSGLRLSNVYTYNHATVYCIPDNVNNYIWYKSFRTMIYNGRTFTTSGQEYVNNSQTILDEWTPNQTYNLTFSTANSGWTNLSYNVYLDLNNDNLFTGLNELIGSATPTGQNTTVTVHIPNDNYYANKNIRLRIQGYEGAVQSPCSADIGNYVDYSVRIKSGTCSKAGYITKLFADSDGDGFGNKNIFTFGNCSFETGFVTDSTDFNDNNSTIYPNAIEFCDQLDNDGDGQIDEGGVWRLAEQLIMNQTITSPIIGAKNSIRTQNSVLVPNGTQSKMITSGGVLLQNGFEAQSGAVFTIQIQEGCGNN